MTTPPVSINVQTITDPSEAGTVAAVAALTFPLACPPHSKPEDIAAHIDNLLSPARFVEYIEDPVKQVIIARIDETIIGYSLLAHETPTIDDVHTAVHAAPGGAEAIASDAVTEISKMYVVPDHHATHNRQKPAHVLMGAAIAAAADRGSTYIWLGVHSGNERAKRYYAKMGFEQVGTKSFDMNGAIEHDFVLGREV